MLRWYLQSAVFSSLQLINFVPLPACVMTNNVHTLSSVSLPFVSSLMKKFVQHSRKHGINIKSSHLCVPATTSWCFYWLEYSTLSCITQSDLFQDDLFPPTKVTWKPTMTSSQWFQGMDKLPPRLNLKPHGMECCELFSLTVIWFLSLSFSKL
jgi:hypothetical protein